MCEDYVKQINEGCDILVLDCEGSEKEILNDSHRNPQNLYWKPDPVANASTDTVKDILKRNGYKVDEIYMGKETDVIEAHR